MSSIFNEMSAMIIRESKKTECGDNYECGECCTEFQNTLANLPVTSSDMVYPVESLPILKCESTEASYMIEHDILTKFMESYDIEDPVEAHSKICEHYDIPTSSLIVVVESDIVTEGLTKHAKKSKDVGMMASYTKTIKDLKNKGIKVAKKKAKKVRFSADLFKADKNLKSKKK